MSMQCDDLKTLYRNGQCWAQNVSNSGSSDVHLIKFRMFEVEPVNNTIPVGSFALFYWWDVRGPSWPHNLLEVYESTYESIVYDQTWTDSARAEVYPYAINMTENKIKEMPGFAYNRNALGPVSHHAAHLYNVLRLDESISSVRYLWGWRITLLSPMV